MQLKEIDNDTAIDSSTARAMGVVDLHHNGYMKRA